MKINRKGIAPPRIEMLPLIDIVFLLLVFFIYAMLSMTVQHGQTIELPSSSTAQIETTEAIAVSVKNSPAGVMVFLNETAINPELLSLELSRLVQKLQDKKKQTVEISADKSLPYQTLYNILDQVKEAGINRISLQANAAETTP